MRDVLIALSPATLVAIAFFGPKALLLIVASIVSAVFCEWAIQKLAKKAITISDGSAAVTGLLLALCMPVDAPVWTVIIGSIFAIAVVKQAFGGLGHNFMNPALAARAVLLISWPLHVTNDAFRSPSFWGAVDTFTGATPLAILKDGTLDIATNSPGLLNLFIGNVNGCIGEVSAAALIIGGLYLLFKRVITWRIPLSFIGTVLVLTVVFLAKSPDLIYLTTYHLLAGGLMLGAFFMATDYSSSPVTPKGQIVMGIGCGLLTVLIRFFGGYPEGVSYAILLMNIASPLIERWTQPKVFGEVKHNART